MTASYHPTYRPRPRSILRRLLARGSTLHRVDVVLVGAVLLLCVIGALLVWSSTRANSQLTGDDGDAYLQRHVVNLAVGLFLGAAVINVRPRALRAAAPIAHVVSLIGLAAVLSPLGRTYNGSHSWISLGGVSLQPAELAKVTLCVCLAVLLAERRRLALHPGIVEVFLALVVAALPMALVVLQPDLGTVMVFAAIVAGVLAVSGVSLGWLLGLALAAVGVGFAAVQLGMLEDYQLARFAAFADPTLDPKGVGYNTNQARIAVGAGGLTGKGLFEGSQTSGQFVPEQHTDFIFTVAGEELGLLGGGAIIALLAVVLWRGCAIALHAQRAGNVVGTLLAAGVVSWFAFQAFENIGMTIGIMPVTGLPLPFVSYGGTAMLANCLAVGLLEHVRVHST
jgi:rod shape determining protein RodA